MCIPLAHHKVCIKCDRRRLCIFCRLCRLVAHPSCLRLLGVVSASGPAAHGPRADVEEPAASAWPPVLVAYHSYRKLNINNTYRCVGVSRGPCRITALACAAALVAVGGHGKGCARHQNQGICEKFLRETASTLACACPPKFL